MPNLRWLLALITAVHRFVYQRSGGRVGGAPALWPRLESSYRYYAGYRRRTLREIPVIVLEPARGPAGSI